MPTLQVDDAGSELYYIDSGAPVGAGQEYLTVFLLHGLIFHGAVFQPMLPFASRYKLRLVIVNQREYPGSSSWDPEDLKRFSSEDFEERFTAVRNIGAELATFMARFIMTHNIPKVTQKHGQRHGGAVLLSWSLGCASSFSFLANAATYPEEVRTCLEQYLRTVVLLDAPVSAFGIPPPTDLYTPLRDPKYSLEEKAEIFRPWISTYGSPIKDPTKVTVAELNERDRNCNAPRAELPSRCLRMTPEELDRISNPKVLTSWLFLVRMPDVYEANTHRALFDNGTWPQVDVLALWCNLTPCICILGGKAAIEYATGQGRERPVRKFRVKEVENANHIFHFDEPERMIRILLENLV